MTHIYTALPLRILEMAEGDEEFRIELTNAIFNGLNELKEKYTEGYLQKDLVKIQQIRHKVKPTLSMFELNPLTLTLQEGKDMLENEGFSESFRQHYQDFCQKVEQAIKEVGALIQVS
jgi:hypothetical protein